MADEEQDDAVAPRRGLRKRSRVNYRSEKVISLPEERPRRRRRKQKQAATPTTRKASPKKAATSVDEEEQRKEGDDSEKQEEHSDCENSQKQEEHGDSDKDVRATKKRKATPSLKPRKRKAKKVGNLTCPNCQKECSTQAALKSHIENCEEAAAVIPAGGRPRSSKSSYKQMRGAVEDRTCPLCKSVFTSINGRDYHVDHKVCLKPTKKKKTSPRFHPLETLEPGSRFVTRFGVVEVVADDRAVPSAERPSNFSQLVQTYDKEKTKVGARGKVVWFNTAVRSWIRRKRLARLYREGTIDQDSIFRVCFGGHPRVEAAQRKQSSRARPPHPCLKEDPRCPKESCPDRMVECILVPDERATQTIDNDDGSEDDDGRESAQGDENDGSKHGDDKDGGGGDATSPAARQAQISTPNSAPCAMKLFLQRRLLTEAYDANAPNLSCPDCGLKFTSKATLDHHADGPACAKASEARREKAAQRLESLEERATKALVGKERPYRAAARKNVSVYPQVWTSLGYQFVATSYIKQKVNEKRDGNESEDLSALEDPDVILANLWKQFRQERDKTLGSVYSEVYSSLGFQFDTINGTMTAGGKQKRKKREKKMKKVKKKRSKRKVLVPAKPPPEIIDVRVLASEIDAGRYPSKKRYKGEHVDECTICRKVGTLFCCDFCSNAVHLACMLTKHTIKHPEPEDDFMCHKCIQYIKAMRTRAEKRRYVKHKLAHGDSGVHVMPKEEESLSVEAGDVELPEESEYHKLASSGRNMSELLELLKDAQARMKDAQETRSINETRRELFGAYLTPEGP